MILVEETQEHMKKVVTLKYQVEAMTNINDIEYRCGCRVILVESIHGDVPINKVTSLKLCDKHHKIRKQEA
jgi:hypothetical protein